MAFSEEVKEHIRTHPESKKELFKMNRMNNALRDKWAKQDEKQNERKVVRRLE